MQTQTYHQSDPQSPSLLPHQARKNEDSGSKVTTYKQVPTGTTISTATTNTTSLRRVEKESDLEDQDEEEEEESVEE
jgi:hypothetical protein